MPNYEPLVIIYDGYERTIEDRLSADCAKYYAEGWRLRGLTTNGAGTTVAVFDRTITA